MIDVGVVRNLQSAGEAELTLSGVKLDHGHRGVREIEGRGERGVGNVEQAAQERDAKALMGKDGDAIVVGALGDKAAGLLVAHVAVGSQQVVNFLPDAGKTRFKAGNAVGLLIGKCGMGSRAWLALRRKQADRPLRSGRRDTDAIFGI